MSEYYKIKGETLTDIADAVREKTESTGGMLATEIAPAIREFEGKVDPVLQSKTVSPSASSQTVKPDSGYDGLSQVTVEGDANLVSDNIKSGVSIFDVVGSYEGSGGSSGGGLHIAEGTITLTEGARSSNTTIATVNGLGFTPAYVSVHMVAGSGSVTSTSQYMLMGVYHTPNEAQATTVGRNSSSMRAYCGGVYGRIVIYEDGFTLNSDSKQVYVSSVYRYIAIG